MTALDQAFVKAFAQQSVPVAAVMPRSAAPVPKRASVCLGDLRTEDTPSIPGGVLAALEKPPKRAMSPPKTEGCSEGARRKCDDEVASAPWAVSSQQWVVGPEPWTIGSEQWAIGEEQSAPDGAPSAAVVDSCCPSPELPTASPAPAEPSPLPVKSPNADQSRPANVSSHDAGAPSVAPVAASPVAAPPEDTSFTIPLYPDKQSPVEPFRPAWQVDHFAWPKVCRRLIARAADELDRLTDALLAANVQGQKVLGVAGYRQGEGATTLLLCAARRLAERGAKLVLIDADFARPRLAKRLGVQPQCGWDETEVEEEESLARAMVEATANNLALLPLRELQSGEERSAGDLSRLARCVDMMRSRYDIVLVDLGPLENALRAEGVAAWASGIIDAVVLAHDPRITSEEDLIKVEGQLAAAGAAALGIVENFAAED